MSWSTQEIIKGWLAIGRDIQVWGSEQKMWAVDTHFRLSVYITEVMGKDHINLLGIL